jgi:two-component system response regulator PilR (NtrC family)
VLTDMRLGDGLGIEIVRQLSASPERTPVAVITAYGSADNAVDALKAGAFDYIAKPVSLEQLRTLILNALGRHRAPRPTQRRLAKWLTPAIAPPGCCRGCRRRSRTCAARCRGWRAAWRPW